VSGLSDAELLKIRTEVQASSAREQLERSRACLAEPWTHDDWPARLRQPRLLRRALVDELERALGREQEWIRTAGKPPTVTAAAPAGQVTLSPADVLTVLGALRDGVRWNDYPPGDPRLAARSLAEDR
jgi:hypothetical protein